MGSAKGVKTGAGGEGAGGERTGRRPEVGKLVEWAALLATLLGVWLSYAGDHAERERQAVQHVDDRMIDASDMAMEKAVAVYIQYMETDDPRAVREKALRRAVDRSGKGDLECGARKEQSCWDALDELCKKISDVEPSRLGPVCNNQLKQYNKK